jgi:hypothetical protein
MLIWFDADYAAQTKYSSREGAEAEKGVVIRRRSFREFARKLRGTDPPLKMFKACAMAADFPSAQSWQEVRGFLVRSGAEHEAIVGARMAWREFRSRSA